VHGLYQVIQKGGPPVSGLLSTLSKIRTFKVRYPAI
jgi:hypothetical protein